MQPLDSNEEDLDENGEPHTKTREERTEENRQTRQEMVENFTKAGNPGLRLSAEFERLKRSLGQPNVVKENLRKIREGEELEDENLNRVYNDLMKAFSEDKHFLIPSFFRLMVQC